MQITDLYQTKITCSTYNANIDSTDTVITVKLIDFNGNAVTNKSVTLTCDKGYFNKKGSTSISGTTTKSITLTTNSSGEITGTWTASEWGLCTFSTSNSSQPAHIQVNVTGWRIHTNNSDYTFLYNHELCELRVHIASTSIPTSPTDFGGFTVPTGYRPATPVVSHIYVGNKAVVQVGQAGNVGRCAYTASALNNVGVYATLQWKY